GVGGVATRSGVGATTGADIRDGGLVRPGRLGDVKIRIPAPNRVGARAILQRYLGDGLPLAGDAGEVVEALLSRVYSPRAEYAELAKVTLRDGRKVAVGGRELISGALLENVIRVAAEEAADREARTDTAGITETDLAAALDAELRGAVSLLTPLNARSYVTRLPQDVDPVAVEPIGRGPGVGLYTRSAVFAVAPRRLRVSPHASCVWLRRPRRRNSIPRRSFMDPCVKVLGADFELANSLESNHRLDGNPGDAAKRLLDEISGYPRERWGGTLIEWG